MASYRVVTPTGQWAAGAIVTDEDIARYPGLGGTARLVDRLHALEPVSDEGVILPAKEPTVAGISRFKPGPKPAKNAEG